MKLSSRLILLLVAAVSVVRILVAVNQVQLEKEALHQSLRERGEITTETLQKTLERVPKQLSGNQLRRTIERFDDREHLAGVAVYSLEGQVLTASRSFAGSASTPPHVVIQAKADSQGIGEFATYDHTSMYIYAVPLHRDSTPAAILVTFHDAGYIEVQSARIWRDALLHLVAQILLVGLITLLVMRSTIERPITQLSQWMKDLRNGKSEPQPPANFLQPLTLEVASLGRSLTEARAAATVETRLREDRDPRWTSERLRAAVRRRLHGTSLFVVSNREPYEHVHGSKGIDVQIPASGLVTALEPILNACDGTWIAHGSANADRETVDAHDHLRVPPDHPHYTLRRVWLTKEEEDGYYCGFSNEGLWPLCHLAYTRPGFRPDDWAQYRLVNEKFAQAVLQEIQGVKKPFVLIQDYHFALLPRLIKASRPEARVAMFWHIPWPNPEAFRICPWHCEILDGLLGADLMSFHIQAHCNNFLNTVDQSVESRIEWDRFTVNRNNHTTMVRPHPISVVFAETTDKSSHCSTNPDRTAILETLHPETSFLAVGVDRMDYTKGILERFRGIERFLDKRQKYMKNFTFIQFGAPSRTNIKRYQEFLAEVTNEAQRINARFQSDRWKPIIFRNWHHSHEEIERYYRAADICLVTSLHDGMNLVAKEFVASRNDEDGVLILSEFTGACRELRDALLVNPYDTEQLAQTIQRALEMPPGERRARMRQMRRTVKEHNVYRWAADLICEFADIRVHAPELVEQ